MHAVHEHRGLDLRLVQQMVAIVVGIVQFADICTMIVRILMLFVLLVGNQPLLSSSQPRCVPSSEFAGILSSTDTDVCMLQSGASLIYNHFVLRRMTSSETMCAFIRSTL